MGSAQFGTGLPSPSPLRLAWGGFAYPTTLQAWTRTSIRALGLPSCVTPSSTAYGWCRNFNRLPIAYATTPRLRSRLTLGGRAFPRNP